MSGLPPPSLALSPSSPRVIASGLREGKRSRPGPDGVGGHAMAKQGFRIADSDMHFLEPADLWLNYIDPRFKARAPVGLTEVPRDVAIEWEGRRIPNNTSLSRRMLQVVQAGQADRYAHAERRGYDAVAQVEAMDQEGIDVAVLFPSRGLFALAVDGMDPELAAAIARAYNEWLAPFCAENPTRLLGAPMLPPPDVDAGVAQARPPRTGV